MIFFPSLSAHINVSISHTSMPLPSIPPFLPHAIPLSFSWLVLVSSIRPSVRIAAAPLSPGFGRSAQLVLEALDFAFPLLCACSYTRVGHAIPLSLGPSCFVPIATPLSVVLCSTVETSTMSGASSRLGKLLAHFSYPVQTSQSSAYTIEGKKQGTSDFFNDHTLSPCFFLPRAAAIEPDAPAIYHRTANNKILRRTYQEFADRARGFAYYVKKKGYSKVGILCTNTPAFLEAIFGIGAAGAINVAINYRLKPDDIAYIFDHSDAEAIIVDAEYVHLLDDFKKNHPKIPLIIDTDTDATEGELSGPFDEAVLEGLRYDQERGNHGWAGLAAQCTDELAINALAYTSGTTARPKGVEYTHRGCYLGALGNVIDSGLSYHNGERARYLWTLPMFHAMGWTFPWAVTAARGTHYCLRKIEYPEIWRLLKEEKITHFCAAPTVNTLLCSDKNAVKLDSPVRVTVAASPPTAHLFEQMESRNLMPTHVYGLTETYGPITKGYVLPAWHDLPVKEKYAKMARQGHGFVTSLPVRVIKTDIEYGVIQDVEKNGKEIGEIAFIGNICARGVGPFISHVSLYSSSFYRDATHPSG